MFKTLFVPHNNKLVIYIIQKRTQDVPVRKRVFKTLIKHGTKQNKKRHTYMYIKCEHLENCHNVVVKRCNKKIKYFAGCYIISENRSFSL